MASLLLLRCDRALVDSESLIAISSDTSSPSLDGIERPSGFALTTLSLAWVRSLLDSLFSWISEDMLWLRDITALEAWPIYQSFLQMQVPFFW